MAEAAAQQFVPANEVKLLSRSLNWALGDHRPTERD